MPADFENIISTLSRMDELQNVRVAVDQSRLGAVVCGAASFAGGVLLGPVGLLAGGTLGGLAAYQMTKGTFQPFCQILLQSLNRSQQHRLIQDIRNAMSRLNYIDILKFLAACSSSREALNLLLKTIHDFLIRSGYTII